MASGYGAFGGVGRCYSFWTKFKECMNDNEDKSLCVPVQEDYLECLHHKKEFARLNKIEEHRRHVPTDDHGGGGH